MWLRMTEEGPVFTGLRICKYPSQTMVKLNTAKTEGYIPVPCNFIQQM